MAIRFSKLCCRVLAIGALSGSRTSAGAVIASQVLRKGHSSKLQQSRLGFMQASTTANILMAMAAGEAVVDKLPFTGDRIAPVGVAGRCASAALAGACLYKAGKKSSIAGALTGAAAALVATYASFYLRKFLVKHTHLKDPVVGAVEDAVVIGAGIALIKTCGS